MTGPKSTDELAKHIEQVVERFIDDTRQAALESLGRAFSSRSRTKSGRRSGAPAAKKVATATSRTRRTPAEIAGVGDQLCELVRATPGQGMAELAAELGLAVRDLHRPMSTLRRDERVRTVGQRDMMRYFPAVEGGAK